MVSQSSLFSAGMSRRAALRQFVSGAAMLTACSAWPRWTGAQNPPTLASASVGEGITHISGAGGNILLLAGADGVVSIDSGLEAVSVGTLSEIAKAAPGPLAMVVNTHWHFDHSGGNDRFHAAGARVVASENSRKRMASEQYTEFLKRTTAPSPKGALPTVTFSAPTTLYVNDEELRLTPVAPAHTDGDVIVRLEKANVMHLGDLFFNGAYPYIDYSSGGWLGGMLEGVTTALTLADAKTKVVPGHGPLASYEDLKGYSGLLETFLERFSKAKQAGKTADELVAAGILKDYDEKLGKGFLKPEQFVRNTYAGLLKHQ